MRQAVFASRKVFAAVSAVLLLGGLFLACDGGSSPTAPEAPPGAAAPAKSLASGPADWAAGDPGLDPGLTKAKAPKVDVCHQEGNGSYHVINVAEPSVPAHVGHGDWLVGEELCDDLDNDCDGEIDEDACPVCPCDFGGVQFDGGAFEKDCSSSAFLASIVWTQERGAEPERVRATSLGPVRSCRAEDNFGAGAGFLDVENFITPDEVAACFEEILALQALPGLCP